MRKIQVTAESLYKYKKKQFVLLGAEEATMGAYLGKNIEPKIKKEAKEPVPGFWGTLGMKDNSLIDWDGFIEISSYGNDNSNGVTLEEIELIYEANPHLNNKDLKVTERFISFENLHILFPDRFTPDQIPELRLTLMLGQNEGALVYYQFNEGDNSEGDAIEYIQPQKTEGFETNKRDRLNYYIPVLPDYKIEEGDEENSFRLSRKTTKETFLVKILTFIRTQSETSKDSVDTASKIVMKVAKKLNIYHEHKLLLFDAEENDFKTANSGMIDQNKLTLFVIHGTFGDTKGSFSALYGDNKNWFKQRLKNYGGKYEQIIAFDHPTVFYDAQGNIDKLFEMLGDDFRFSKPVDVIGTSQGGLLTQYLANLPQNKSKITVGKAALVASANGVDYFTAGRNISKFLSIMKSIFKTTSRQTAAIICSIAQHSADFFLDQPGCQLMTPGNSVLVNILNNTPSGETTYLPVIDDFTKELVEKEPLLKRWAAIGIDLLTQTIMGKYNDWVVRTKNQWLIPKQYCYYPNYDPNIFVDRIIPAIHGKCIGKEAAQDEIRIFFEG